MKSFDINNPPKTLRISKLTLPDDPEIEIHVPYDGLSHKVLRNFNQFSEKQLLEYQVDMMKNWGDITLTLSYSHEYIAIYEAKRNSKFRKYLRNKELGVWDFYKKYGSE